MESPRPALIIERELGTRTPSWHVEIDQDVLVLNHATDAPPLRIPLTADQISAIRDLSGVTSALLVEVCVGGTTVSLYLLGKKVSQTRWSGTAADYSDVDAVARNFSQALAFAEQVVSEANAVVVIIDQRGTIQRFNRVAEEYVGMSEVDIIGQSAHDLFMFGSEKAESQSNIQGFFDRGQAYEVERTINTVKGHRSFLFRNSFALDAGWTNERFLICSGIDITDERHAQARLTAIANTDVLTGLSNRHFFTELLHREFAGYAPDGSFSVLYLDLDNFKEINDRLGHQDGDRLLRKVAARLQGCVRGSEKVMRIGGDEFIIAVSGDDSAERAEAIARDVIEEFKVVFVLAGKKCPVRLSIGIASLSSEDTSQFDILSRADRAMYTAKAIGKASLTSNFCVHTPEISGLADRDLEMQQALRQALATREFKPEFHRTYDAASGESRGTWCELLWHPRGVSQPFSSAKLLHFAESCGLGVQLGEIAAEAVCFHLQSLDTSPSLSDSVTVSFSSAQIIRGDVAGSFRHWTSSFHVDPSRIRLTVPAEALASPTPEFARKLSAIREAGVRVLATLGAISPFPNLLATELDGFVFESDLTSRLPDDQIAGEHLKAIMGFCTAVGLQVIALGVDSIDMAHWLSRLGEVEVAGAALPYRTGASSAASDATIR